MNDCFGKQHRNLRKPIDNIHQNGVDTSDAVRVLPVLANNGHSVLGTSL
jgi:phage regulator Rha-like protein